MRFLKTAASRAGVAGEVLTFFANSKRLWLLPMISVVLLTAVVVLLAESSALAPFIYSLF